MLEKYAHKIQEYADGLRQLPEILARIVPEATLRVFIDGSLARSAIWGRTLSQIASAPNTQIVFARCPFAHEPGREGHYDLFGTILRFTGFFGEPPGEAPFPPWLAPPPEGGLAMSFEVDLSTSSMEFNLGFLRRVIDAGPRAPDILSITVPCAAVPWRPARERGPYLIIAGLVATRTRLPHKWLEDYFDDAAEALTAWREGRETIRPGAAAIIHQGRASIGWHDFAMRRPEALHPQGSPFAYGVDEWLLNHVLVPLLQASPQRRSFAQVIAGTAMTYIRTVLLKLTAYNTSPSPVPMGAPAIKEIFKLAEANLSDGSRHSRPPPRDNKEALQRVNQYLKFIKTRMPNGWNVVDGGACPGAAGEHIMPGAEYARRTRQLLPIIRYYVEAQRDRLVAPDETTVDNLRCAIRPLHVTPRALEPIFIVAWVIGGGEILPRVAQNGATEFDWLLQGLCNTVIKKD